MNQPVEEDASASRGRGAGEPSEDQWAQERDGFAREDAAERAAGHRDYPGHGHVPDDSSGLPLLGTVFADLATTLLTSRAPQASEQAPEQAPEQAREQAREQAPEHAGDLASVLDWLVDAGERVVPAADLVSVTLRRDGEERYSTPAQTDPVAGEIDQAQYAHGEGPCVTALEKGGLGTAASADLADDTTWTRFGPAAAALGAGSVFAVGLFPVGEPPLRGALNLYAREVGGFTSADRDAALLLASHAAVALAYVNVSDAAELARTRLASAEAHLDTAKVSRDVIGQAKGLLMERQGLSADEAFDVLRRASQDLNVKLRDVAETFLAHRHEL